MKKLDQLSIYVYIRHSYTGSLNLLASSYALSHRWGCHVIFQLTTETICILDLSDNNEEAFVLNVRGVEFK